MKRLAICIVCRLMLVGRIRSSRSSADSKHGGLTRECAELEQFLRSKTYPNDMPINQRRALRKRASHYKILAGEDGIFNLVYVGE